MFEIHPHKHEDLRDRVGMVGSSYRLVLSEKRMLMELVALGFPQVEAADKSFQIDNCHLP